MKTIDDTLRDMIYQLRRSGVEPKCLMFGDGFIDAVAKERAQDPEIVAVLMISRFPDGYLGHAYDHMRDLAAEFAKEEKRRKVLVESTMTLQITDPKAIEWLQRLSASCISETVTIKHDNTWREHFRSERPYGKKSRRKR